MAGVVPALINTYPRDREVFSFTLLILSWYLELVSSRNSSMVLPSSSAQSAAAFLGLMFIPVTKKLTRSNFQSWKS
jgi:hypothetical protein